MQSTSSRFFYITTVNAECTCSVLFQNIKKAIKLSVSFKSFQFKISPHLRIFLILFFSYSLISSEFSHHHICTISVCTSIKWQHRLHIYLCFIFVKLLKRNVWNQTDRGEFHINIYRLKWTTESVLIEVCNMWLTDSMYMCIFNSKYLKKTFKWKQKSFCTWKIFPLWNMKTSFIKKRPNFIHAICSLIVSEILYC